MGKWLVGLGVVGLVGIVHAADQSILGTQMQVKDPKPGVDAAKRSFVVQAREKPSANTIVGNPVAKGALLTIFTRGSTPTTQSYALPASSWSALRGGAGFKYADPKLASGPVKTLQVKAAKSVFQLKATASGKTRGIDVVPPNPATDACLRFEIVGGDRYDVLFPAPPLATIKKNDAKTFAMKKVTAEGSCQPFCEPTDVTGCFPTLDPSGGPHTFVVSGIDVPTNGSEAQALGFDLDGKPNDGIDNQLGAVLGAFQALIPALDMQAAFDQAVDQGTMVWLVDVQASSAQIYAGTTTMTPPACIDGSDTVCRQQFTGTGQFNVDLTGPSNARLDGALTVGTFVGGAGALTLRLSLAGETFDMPLHAVRGRITGVTTIGWPTGGSKIGGAIATTDVDAVMLHVIGNPIRAAFDDTCDVGGTPPACGCTAGGTGALLKNLFDEPPTQDCVISDAELTTVLGPLLTPDIDLDTDGTNDAVSVGLGITGVAGSFVVP